MSNTYFQFKQFTVHQDKSAMKVCTDSCILGAYANYSHPNKILDIGTGTGLLSLMLGQKYTCKIDAVEIDDLAAEQAEDNFKNSEWFERINLHKESIQLFQQKASEKYDLIVCNPPFFQDHLKSPSASRNTALHSDHLTYKDLIHSAEKLLSSDGLFYVLLPEYQSSLFELLALKRYLFPIKKLTIFNRQDSSVFRIITVFSHQKKEFLNERLIIKDEDGGYTSGFKRLLKDYYLHL
jgi:tRNA1Val (adenine37-N6)-methyltransferase